jgi:hypothetical protein
VNSSHAQIAIITNQIIEGFVSAKRLKVFLGGDELQPDAREVTVNPNLSTGDVVCYSECSDVNILGNEVSGVGNQRR